MSDFNAGSARGTYILDISQAEQAAARLKALFAGIKADAAGLGGTGGGAAQGLNQQSAAAKRALSDFERLDRQYNQMRDSEIRLARAQGDRGKALQLVNGQIQSATPNTLRYNNLLIQQANILKQGNGLAQQFSQGISSGIAGIIGPAAIATAGITALFGAVQAGVSAGGEALALREQRNSLRAVAGDARLYAEAIDAAKRQQLLFGGSFRENIEGIQGLTIVSRESGASLQQLVDLTSRLNLKSPEQGIGGARIAITEALSGNVTSLARRFEIPKDKLKELGDTSLPVAERLAAIDTYLAKIGITSEAVAGKVDKDALAFRRLNAELEQAKINAGDALASAFSASATGLARLIGLVNNNPDAIAELKAVAISQLTGRPAVTTDADRTQARRSAAEESATSALGQGPLGVGAQIVRAGGLAEYRALHEQLTLITLANADAGESARQLTAQWADGLVETEAYRAGLDALQGSQTVAVSGYDQYTAALVRAQEEQTLARAAIAENTLETLKNTVEKDKQRQAMDLLVQQAQLVANGVISEKDAIAALTPVLGAAAEEAFKLQLELTKVAGGAAAGVDQLARIQIQLDGVRQQANSAGGALAAFNAIRAARIEAGQNELKSIGDRLGKGAGADTLAENKRIADARRDFEYTSLKNNAQRIAFLQKELADTADIAKRYDLQTQILNLRNSTARAHTSELGSQLKLNESIYDSQQKQYRAALDLEELTIRNRQDTRKEDEELRRLRNTAQNASDPRIRAAAADQIALIDVGRRQRAAEIAEKQGISGAPIVNGRILESLRGGASGGSGAVPAVPGVPGGVAGGAEGGGVVNQTLVYLDGDEIAARLETRVVARALAGQRAATAGGGGRGAP